jgi:lipoprotein-releasing system ATP-binding protein
MPQTNGEATPLLEARGLTKRYRSGDAELTIFKDLHLALQVGGMVALTGESGAGKSTLLHLLGLLDAPTAGEIVLDGRPVPGSDEAAAAEIRNRDFGFVWQINTLLPEFTALENVMMPLLIRGTSRAAAAEPAQERLREVGLDARGHHRSGELSGGEQQRVALARALVTRPRLLLADEPTGSLDEKTGARIMDLLCELHQAHRLTTLYVTHNLDFARRAPRRLELHAGVLKER